MGNMSRIADGEDAQEVCLARFLEMIFARTAGNTIIVQRIIVVIRNPSEIYRRSARL
jgi:hypothetical protein